MWVRVEVRMVRNSVSAALVKLELFTLPQIAFAFTFVLELLLDPLAVLPLELFRPRFRRSGLR